MRLKPAALSAETVAIELSGVPVLGACYESWVPISLDRFGKLLLGNETHSLGFWFCLLDYARCKMVLHELSCFSALL